MLKERKLWITLRNLEKSSGDKTVPRYIMIETILRLNDTSFPWMKFSDEIEIMRVFESMVGKHTWHENVYINNEWIRGVKTDPRGDGYFYLLRWCTKVADEFGILRFLGLLLVIILAISSLVPESLGYKFFQYIIVKL